MTEPNDTDSLIAGHFDGMNSPEENALLTELLLSDPRAAESFVEAARFEAMLEQRMPLVTARRRPLWLWLGAAAALAAAGFITLRLLQRQDAGDHGTPADGELKWEPVKDARVPLTGHSAWALQAWEQMHMAEPDSFVPVPEVTLEEWLIEDAPAPALKIRTTANYPADWKRKLNQARACAVRKDGVIDLGAGKSIKLSYIALASPQWPKSRPASWGDEGIYFTPPVYFDHFGNVITGPERISNGKDAGLMTRQSRNHSTVELGLDMAGCADGRILALEVFDAASHAWLTARASWSSLDDISLKRISSEALIASPAPLTIALEVAVPAAETITLPATPGSKARTSLEEALFVKGCEGIWADGGMSASPGNTSGWEKLSLREGFFKYRAVVEKTTRNQSCTLAVSLPGELEADLFAVTESGEVAPLKMEGTQRDRWMRLAYFLTPLESVRAVRIKPYSRRRVLLTVTPPGDPWSGLNAGITDAMELRIPTLQPQTEEARIAVQVLLGIDERKTYRMSPNPGEPPQFHWSFGQDWKHDEMKNATVREVLLELGRMKQQEIEIEVPARLLRSGPIK